MSSKVDKSNEAYFKVVLEDISIDGRFEIARANTLLKLMSYDKRKQVSDKFNRTLKHFKDNFIKNFIGYNGYSAITEKSETHKGSIKDNWYMESYAPLTRAWARRKELAGVASPSYFKFGQTAKDFVKKDGTPVKNRPEKTLEEYINEHWDNIIERLFGLIKPSDIVFLDSTGHVVGKRGGLVASEENILKAKIKQYERDFGKATEPKKQEILKDIRSAGLTNPFQRLHSARGYGFTTFKEEFSIGFSAFPKIGEKFGEYGGSSLNVAEQLKITELFVPSGDNTASKGFPFSKLTNNTLSDKKWRGPFRPSIVELIQWYYTVKLPTILRSHYKKRKLF